MSCIDTQALLEKHYRDMQDIEFTVQEGKFYMLQTRSGKRTGRASVKIAVDMVNEGLITESEALMRVSPEHVEAFLHPMVDPAAKTDIVATGLPASPGGATGKVVFSAEEAVSRGRRRAQRGAGAARNHPGRYPRHESRRRHSHGAGRHDLPRGGGGQRHGRLRHYRLRRPQHRLRRGHRHHRRGRGHQARRYHHPGWHLR